MMIMMMLISIAAQYTSAVESIIIFIFPSVSITLLITLAIEAKACEFIAFTTK